MFYHGFSLGLFEHLIQIGDDVIEFAGK